MAIPPHDLHIEAAVLGACLISTNAVIQFMDSVKPELHFYDARHIEVAKAIQELAKEGAAIDLVTVPPRLKFPEARLYVTDLAMAVATTASTPYYIQQLSEYATRRQLLKATSKIAISTRDLDKPLQTVTEEASRLVGAAIDSTAGNDTLSTHASMTATLDSIIQNKYGEAKLGLPTGFPPLDDILVGGLAPGDLVIAAARPGMGKTAFAMDVAWKAATRGGVVAVFSLEMTRSKLDMRLLSSISGIAHYKLLTGQVTDEEIARLTDIVATMNSLRLHVFDKMDASPQAVLNKCKRLKHEYGELALFVVDYLQLMNLETGNKGDNSVNKLEIGTRQLKRGAVELDAPGLVLSQLSRGVEESARPTLQRLRGSGSIEQDADKVLFLYRPGYYFPESCEEGLTEVIVAKNRNGRCDTAELLMNMKTTNFMTA